MDIIYTLIITYTSFMSPLTTVVELEMTGFESLQQCTGVRNEIAETLLIDESVVVFEAVCTANDIEV